jgi:hypothetical protein
VPARRRNHNRRMLASGIVLLAAAAASPRLAVAVTAQAQLPRSTAGYSRVVIHGGRLAAVASTGQPGDATIPGLTITLAGAAPGSTVRARYGAAAPVSCPQQPGAPGPQTSYLCTGPSQPATASSVLTIDVT